MSIVTLKRKTSAKYNNVSVSQPQFSLNGTRRLQGYIGQDTLGRSLPRTPMRGTNPIGYGGCCGQYPTEVNITYGTGVYSENNPTVIKPSVINTDGMLMKRNQYYKGHWNVKKFDYSYIDKVRNRVIVNCTTKRIQKSTDAPCTNLSNKGCINKRHYTSNINFRSNDVIVTKETHVIPMNQSEYLSGINKKCLVEDLDQYPVQSTYHTPIL